MTTVAVSGSFDDLRSRHVRFLEEASKLADLHVFLWSDKVFQAMEGKPPKFPTEERHYFVEALRYVKRVTVVQEPFERDALPRLNGEKPAVWAVQQAVDTAGKKRFAEAEGITYRVIPDEQLKGFPPVPAPKAVPGTPGKKKVLVTGCFDWLHTGHVRFFEEVSELGDLYVVVGHDANIELLKGAGHPQFREQERRYMVGAMRYVAQALVSSGSGWMDAEPEIAVIKPDMYAVNEDGDKPEKKTFCEQHGLQYVVLKRLPKPGLPRRQSTDLRGF